MPPQNGGIFVPKYNLKRPDPKASICQKKTEPEHSENETNMPKEDEPMSQADLNNLEKVAAFLERSKLNSYVDMMGKPKLWIWMNLWGGVARGIGMAIGFTILGAVLFLILQQIVMLNLPIISNFFAEILDMVESYRSVSP